jgi:hypothetical protein
VSLDLSPERLAAALPIAPHDFVPGLSAEGDRALVARHLLRPLEPEHDLRFRHGAATVLAEVMPWDSAFFGLRLARLPGVFLGDDDPGPALDALLERARARGVRYLLAQPDARETALARALGERGFALIETRLIYHRELAGFSWPERFATRLAGPADVPSLAETARKMVNRYDRFHADPALDAAKVDALMRVWVENSVLAGFADATVCADVPAPRAFCTAKYHEASWPAWGKRLAQPVFSAVDTEMKGWYRKIISELTYHLRERGAEHAFMVTQATNKAVVHVWESLGYRFGRCENVLRVLL